MITAIAQIKLKTANFNFNYENIIKHIENTDCDLIIFPSADISSLGGKDLVYDETLIQKEIDIYEKIADKNYQKTILIGNILIRNGETEEVEFFDFDGKKIFVSDEYIEDVDCDIYILSKNKYFAMNSYNEFVESINPKSNFIYINSIGMADENIFAGGSFAKNIDNEIVIQMPLCEECIETVDFTRAIEFKEENSIESVYKVTKFALKEYCENTGFKKVILGLSGGIDSALTAALAAEALGKENVLGVLMPSMFSSEGSIKDSLELAENLGIKTIKHSITPLFDNFIEKVAHERLHDLAEENLQARLRGLTLMFFSNRDGYLLLSTGNKSEAAMGYGTLYGDLAGGYNLICDLTKTNVYKLSNYINRDREIIPQAIIDKAPSAELRPNQKDQDSLPEYAVLDDIIEMYVEQNCPVEEIYAKYDKVLVDDTIKKIYKAQFKRKQCCLGVRLTERSFTNGVSYPIIRGYN